MAAARFVVHGRVQGVGFRFTTVREATRLGLTGRVWNRTDGSVELVAEGGAEALTSLERWLHQGPPAARVERVERTNLAASPGHDRFEIS